MGRSLNMQAREAIGKQYLRNHSSQTNTAIKSSINTITQFIQDRFGLEKIENLKTHMVNAFVSARLENGVGVSQLTRDATAMRLIAGAINKPNIVARTNSELGINRPMSERYSPKDANEERLAVIREALQERAERTGEAVDRALIASYDLRQAFGVRSNESIMSRVVLGTNGKPLLQVLGAKGGLIRYLAPKTLEQFRALEQYRDISRGIGNCNGKMIPPDLSSRQQYDYQRNVIRSLGGIKANNAHMHVQRHRYAQERIANGDKRQYVAVDLGHGREEACNHYA